MSKEGYNLSSAKILLFGLRTPVPVTMSFKEAVADPT